MITYDFPLHEKVRTWLRLEDLFEKVIYFSLSNHELEHHAALTTLFDVLEITGRSDLKLELLQELERQRQKFEFFRTSPDVSKQGLDKALSENQHAAALLLTMQGKPGQTLRDNGWLTTIRNRAGIPGGVCEFDLPSYHYWLHSEPEKRRQDLAGWIAPLLDLRNALTVVLRVLRSSGTTEHWVAHQGAYQLMLAGRTAQLALLRLEDDQACVPEISANRYALNIRFVTPNTETRPVRIDTDVPFELTFCDL
jgi:cell division protein ZapD